MSDMNVGEVCPFCKQGHIVNITREMTFQQMTDKGRITCRITVPIGTCSHCGSETLDGEAEAMVDQAVRREYDKLPPAGGQHG
jgi:YgiT-type zinc finger domain-containing protein